MNRGKFFLPVWNNLVLHWTNYRKIQDQWNEILFTQCIPAVMVMAANLDAFNKEQNRFMDNLATNINGYFAHFLKHKLSASDIGCWEAILYSSLGLWAAQMDSDVELGVYIIWSRRDLFMSLWLESIVTRFIWHLGHFFPFSLHTQIQKNNFFVINMFFLGGFFCILLLFIKQIF